LTHTDKDTKLENGNTSKLLAIYRFNVNSDSIAWLDNILICRGQYRMNCNTIGCVVFAGFEGDYKLCIFNEKEALVEESE
jgi:hypothetical protein